MTEYPNILGVYSHHEVTTVGTGSTRNKHNKTTYWFVRQIGADRLDVQPINIFHVPSGMREFINEDKFLKEYMPEPKYYQHNTVPALQSLHEKIARGEESLDEGDLDTAEREFLKALMIDDMNVDANYGIGSVYSEKNEKEKLAKVLRTLMGLEEAFTREHTLKLNSFGVRLRKNGQLDQAAAFLEKALEMNSHDDHIMFNLARVYFDRKDFTQCQDMLRRALETNPSFVEAGKFLRYCEKMAEQ